MWMRFFAAAGFIAASSAALALAQGCRCSEWEGFKRVCVPCPEPVSGISDEVRDSNRKARELRRQQAEARRQQRERDREQRRVDRILQRIDVLIAEANADLKAERIERALDRLWEAYDLSPNDPALRANVIRVVLHQEMARGQKALLRGDASEINRIRRRYQKIVPLFDAGIAGVRDEADLILQEKELESIVADLGQAEQDRRRREVRDRLEDPTDALEGQRLRENAIGPALLTYRWATGKGERDYAFGPNHQVTRDLRNSAHGRLVRYLLYQKYGGRLRNGDSFTNYPAPFGVYGLFTTRTLSEQFVGSFRVDAEVVDGRVRYTATNTTSFTSFLYGVGTSWEARTLRPMSNMRQTYVWWEPVQRWPGK